MTKILIADDDAPVRRGLARHFDGHPDYRVHFVSSGEEALNYLKDHVPDVVLTDSLCPLDGSCPPITGVEVIRHAAKRNPMLRSGVITAEPVAADRMFSSLGQPRVYLIEKSAPVGRSFQGEVDNFLRAAVTLSPEAWSYYLAGADTSLIEEARAAYEWKPEFEPLRMWLIEKHCDGKLERQEKADFKHLQKLHGAWLDGMGPRLDQEGWRRDLEELRAMKAAVRAGTL